MTSSRSSCCREVTCISIVFRTPGPLCSLDFIVTVVLWFYLVHVLFRLRVDQCAVLTSSGLLYCLELLLLLLILLLPLLLCASLLMWNQSADIENGNGWRLVGLYRKKSITHSIPPPPPLPQIPITPPPTHTQSICMKMWLRSSESQRSVSAWRKEISEEISETGWSKGMLTLRG